ncbi:MAG: hypothetical protein J6Y78_01545 [Paludibacteraceae bacterium]|nr:hypothetical protein [Paludibacteraceae bacterium]
MNRFVIVIQIVLLSWVACLGHAQDTKQEHTYVDLKLPSGTLWATCNIGANNPWEIGNHFLWGETVPIEEKDSSGYLWGQKGNYIKYGEVDNKMILDKEDDAASVLWGGKWRMPTNEELEELKKYCFCLTVRNYKRTGVGGQIFISKRNGKKIFLPVDGLFGNYWTASLYQSYQSNQSDCVHYHHFVSKIHFERGEARTYPIQFTCRFREVRCLIRPVMSKDK